MELRKAFVSVLVIVVVLTIFMVEFLFFGTRVLNVSAVEAVDDIGVYWDENCSTRVYSISWGVLSPGEVKEVVVYVRNEGSESFPLFLTPMDWNPESACRYLFFSWRLCEDRAGARIEVGEIVEVTQSLLVSPYTRGITDFSFGIIFDRSPSTIPGDVNGDRKVDGKDIAIMTEALLSSVGQPGYVPYADVNCDGRIDGKDIAIACKHFGQDY